MATPTSSVPRVKAALLRLMDTDATLETVKHDWGPPPQDRLQHTHIWLADVKDMERDPRVGNQTRHEAYTLDVVFSVARGGYDSEAVELSGWDLVNAFELALNADPQLVAYNGGQLIAQPLTATVGSIGQRSFPALEGGWASEITVSLHCDAYLRNT